MRQVEAEKVRVGELLRVNNEGRRHRRHAFTNSTYLHETAVYPRSSEAIVRPAAAAHDQNIENEQDAGAGDRASGTTDRVEAAHSPNTNREQEDEVMGSISTSDADDETVRRCSNERLGKMRAIPGTGDSGDDEVCYL